MLARKRLIPNAIAFPCILLAFVGYLIFAEGFAVNPRQAEVYMEKYKYLNNLIEQPYLLVAMLIGVVLVLFGIGKTASSALLTARDLV